MTEELDPITPTEPETGDPIFYIKMINGDDVFCMLRATEQFLIMKDPMVITSSIDVQGNKFMSLHRWAPFAADPVIKVVPANVMVCEPLSDSMSQYYWVSVVRHQKEFDPELNAAAKRATEVVAGDNKAVSDLEEKMVLSRTVPFTNTKN